MADERVRIAFVGCGLASLIQYTPAVRYLKNGIVTALCDPDPEAVERLARYHPQAEHFNDYAELLGANVADAVIILTPTRLHADQVVAAAGAGMHVLCEKPLAGTLAECDRMIAACDQASVVFMSGFMKRFDKSLRHVKAAIDDGSLGQVHTLTCDWRGRPLVAPVQVSPASASPPTTAQGWRFRLGQGGGLLADLGAHTADLSRWWLGDIAVVSGEFGITGAHSEVDDQACAVFVHEGGQRSIHLLGATHERWHESYQVDGTEATIRVEFLFGASHATTQPFRITRYTEGGSRMVDETLYPHWSMDLELEQFGRYTLEVEHFCECILEGRTPIASGEDGRKATEAISAAYLSSYREQKVRLPLDETPDLDAMFVELKAAN